MHVIFASVKWQHALVYTNDFIIVSKILDDHSKHIVEVIHLLMKAEVTTKLKTCHFYSKCIDYLGSVVAPGKLKMARKTTEAVEALQYLKNISEIPSLLGFCSLLRNFMLIFRRPAAPFNKKLKKGEPSLIKLDTADREAVVTL